MPLKFSGPLQVSDLFLISLGREVGKEARRIFFWMLTVPSYFRRRTWQSLPQGKVTLKASGLSVYTEALDVSSDIH